ncbi:hypothetical protein [Cognataquiflexum rubidum]|uniref:hypothetical protein n=1 Tax=Cognataquiflexum rubidum TaxID=2922273 RepID=UPI001F13C5EA|nr:hypothetical protein [Cognataquiflexum rubidum]MCH6235357.1 hypothetical protein [Cognataquiflexum rubidum]
MKITTFNRSFFLIYLGLIISISGCKITLVPSYDAQIKEQIESTSKEIDRFYLTMMDKTTNSEGGRSYEQFREGYINIEVELLSLLKKNRVRPLNTHSTRIGEITLELWRKYKQEHKEDNAIPDGLIKLNMLAMSDLFYAMLIAEKGKELAENPPAN